jgi:hypothetical protein
MNINHPRSIADGYYSVNAATDGGQYILNVAVIGGKLFTSDGREVPLRSCSNFSELPTATAVACFWDLYAKEVDRLRARVRRLEEAGDRMRLLCADGDDCDAWNKAKANQ